MPKLFYVLLLFAGYWPAANAVGQTKLTQTIYFDKGSYAISDSNIALIKTIAEKCATDSFGTIKMLGFADTTGTEKYNDWLSEERLQAVWQLIKPYCKKTMAKPYLEAVGESPNDYDYHLKSAPFQQRAVLIIVQFYKH